MSAPDYSRISVLAQCRLVESGIDIVRRAGIQAWSERHIALHDREIVAGINQIRDTLDEIEAELAKGQPDV